MLNSVSDICIAKKENVYLKYIFSQRNSYSFTALKALMMMSSVFPRRCRMKSTVIALQYTKTRCHSDIFFCLRMIDFIPTLQYHIKAPANLPNAFTGLIKESKHFIFPGFIKHLRLPRWNYSVNISYNPKNNLSSYPLFFTKASFLD
jgi:hypothetical protein